MANTGRTNIRILIGIIVGSLVLVAISAFTRYIYAKDYYFLVEAPCDAETENCYIRSCDDYCPPYSVYSLKASYFEQCSDNSCENICTPYNENICAPITCEASDEQECSDQSA